jgi:hypothetical protein
MTLSPAVDAREGPWCEGGMTISRAEGGQHGASKEEETRGNFGERQGETAPMVKGIKRGKRESDAAPTTPPTQGQARMICIDHAIVVEFERLLLPRNPNPLAKPRRRAVVKLSLSPVPHLLLQQVPPRARRASRLASNCLSRCEAEGASERAQNWQCKAAIRLCSPSKKTRADVGANVWSTGSSLEFPPLGRQRVVPMPMVS